LTQKRVIIYLLSDREAKAVERKKFKGIWKKSLTNLKESDIIVKLSRREIAKTAS